MKKIGMKKYFLKYTLIFCVLAIAVYGYFIIYHKSFVYNGDGLLQHYNALCYYAKWLRSIVKTLLFEHRLVIPEWSFSIGYGSDIIATLHYYVVGDPFNLMSVFVPLQYMKYYYMIMMLFRMYCAGLSFSYFCFYMFGGKRSHTAVLTGSFLYVFCAYAMHSAITHPYFINPMIYFPLLLVGAEKIIRKRNPLLFVVTVCVSACSNFYFFYMLAIFTAVYTIVRLFYEYGRKQFLKICIGVGKIGCFAVLGLMVGAVIFLPVMLSVLQDSRLGGDYSVDLLYPASYYTRFLGSFLSYKGAGYWSLMGFAGIALVAVVFLFVQRKKYRLLKSFFLLLTGLLMFPAAAWFLNGCSYSANRWIWAYGMLIAVIVAAVWPDLMQIRKKECMYLMAGLTVYLCCCLLLDNSRTANTAFAVTLALLSVCLIQCGSVSLEKQGTNLKWRERSVFLLLAVNIAVNAYYGFSLNAGDYPARYVDIGAVDQVHTATQDIAVAEAAKDEEGFFRYTQNEIHNNSTLTSGLHSTQYYWSLSNSAVVASNASLGILNLTHNNYLGLNERTGLTALANVKYFTNPQGRGSQYAPYGYEYVGAYSVSGDGGNLWDVYMNQLALPFGYTYSASLDGGEFEKLSPIQKEEAMLQGVLLDAEDEVLTEISPELQDVEVPYEVICENSAVSFQNHSFVTTEKNASVTLKFEGLENSETFLLIQGLEYQGCSPLDLYADDSVFDPLNLYTAADWQSKSVYEKRAERSKYKNWQEEDLLKLQLTSAALDGGTVSRTLQYLTPKYSWYAGQKDFAVNFAYSDAAKDTVKITFPSAGIYSFDNLQIICRPVKNYQERVQLLGQEHLEDVIFETDRITGTIQVSADKVLCLSIPYAKGWTAYVNGQETKIYQANMMYQGLLLEEGTHTVELRYHTPGLRQGMMISVLGIIMTVFVLARRKRI